MNANNKVGRKPAIQSLSGGEQDKINWMLSNMHNNKAYKYLSDSQDKQRKVEILRELKSKYVKYRENWNNQPKLSFKKKLFGKKIIKEKINPLCLDIEVAAVCDLACPFCFRQYIATPDKMMSKSLAFKLIDQASEMDVPSMKFNWRGEPLLNPKLPLIIDYAKQKGVLETIINTSATKLDFKMSQELINAGLDIMIYSFDGGTKKNYEKMRPGRFSKNSFEKIYNNIKNFSKIRQDMNAKLPRTKIQMILTDKTRSEQKEFFLLFKDIVDDVSVKQYTERGGKLIDTNDDIKKKLASDFEILQKKFGPSAELMTDSNGNVFISEGRLPCEQPFQRMLSTYDGRTSMCCYDWGAMHPIGFVDDLAINTGDKEYKKVKKKSDNKEKGFEMMNLQLPKLYNKLSKKVETLKNIWHGKEINKVRELHVNNKLEEVKICKSCPFKETYKWRKIN